MIITYVTYVISMTEIELQKRKKISRANTTIAVKMATKYKLLDMSRDGESYNDVISRLISTNEMLEKYRDYSNKLLEEHDIKAENIIEIFEMERGIDSIVLKSGDQIRFTYNKPVEWPFNESYRMDIQIEKIISSKRQYLDDQMKNDPKLKLLVHLWMVAKIIGKHFDSAYSLPSNKSPIDPFYWRGVWKMVNLSEESYLHDIMYQIQQYEDAIND